MVDTALICAGVIAFAVFLYVLLDGFDLGVGILFLLAPGEQARDVMMASIAPVWDGNETWLVLGGVVLFAGFPLAYATLLPTFYIPIMMLLFALVFRGVAFEFRAKAERGRRFWDIAFAAGSLVAALAQGFLLGAYVQGVALEDGEFAGSALDWRTPFSVMTAVALVAGYALLGATWLVLKTERGLQEWSRVVARPLARAVLIFLATVSVMTPALDPTIAERWFGGGNLVWLWPIPLASVVVGYALWRSLFEPYERAPFLLTIGVFMLGYLGLAVSLWPNIIPPSVSIWEAAAPPSSQAFLLAAVALTMPAVLAYTWLAYRVFRGKVHHAEGYSGHD